MPDYLYDNYASNESVERILHVLEGVAPASSSPTTEGDMPWNVALARIAQLMENTAVGLQTPLDKYGEIWVWTGTATMTAITATPTFTKVTGTFEHYSDYLGVTPQPTQDRILITDKGSVFRIDWSMSFIGSPDLTYTFEAYHGGIGIPQSAASETPNASGTAANAVGFGYQYVSGTNIAIDLRVRPSATGWLIPQQAELLVRRVGPRVNVAA